jgi:hypothetical protein
MTLDWGLNLLQHAFAMQALVQLGDLEDPCRGLRIAAVAFADRSDLEDQGIIS